MRIATLLSMFNKSAPAAASSPVSDAATIVWAREMVAKLPAPFARGERHGFSEESALRTHALVTEVLKTRTLAEIRAFFTEIKGTGRDLNVFLFNKSAYFILINRPDILAVMKDFMFPAAAERFVQLALFQAARSTSALEFAALLKLLPKDKQISAVTKNELSIGGPWTAFRHALACANTEVVAYLVNKLSATELLEALAPTVVTDRFALGEWCRAAINNLPGENPCLVDSIGLHVPCYTAEKMSVEKARVVLELLLAKLSQEERADLLKGQNLTGVPPEFKDILDKYALLPKSLGTPSVSGGGRSNGGAGDGPAI